MADEQLPLKPLETIDATTQFAATKVIGGVRKVVQIAQSDLRGLDGKSAIATITNATPPPIPAIGQQVTYTVDSSAGFVLDQLVAIGAASTLKVVGTPTATSIVLENVDATLGPVLVGAKIVPSGKNGAPGAPGLNSTVPGAAGANAFTTVTTQFTIPAFTAQVTATVGSTAFMSVDMALQISGKFFRVATIPNATTVSLTNSVAGQAGTIAATSRVVASGEPGPTGLPGSSSGGVSGLQYTNLNTAGTPATGQIRSADINFVGLSTVTISATDAQTTPKATADVLARLKIGAIIEIAASSTNKVRGTISADYASGTNSFNWSGQVVSGAIANNNTVYLSIISDAPSVGSGGHTVQDETTNLPQRTKLAFVGAGVTATDDAAGNRTVITVPGGSSGAAIALPYQATDPAAVAGTLLLFSRANGIPHMRRPDGTVYPITFGAAVPAIGLTPYLIDDTFTDVANTLLTDHASEVGQWLTLFGFPSLKITALGRATASTNSSGNIQDTTATSYTITTNYQISLISGKTMAIIFRSGLGQTALPNYVLFQIADGLASFYSQTSGAFVLISQAGFNYPAGGDVEIKIVVTPTTLAVIADDGDIYNNSTILSVNNTTHATQTGVGLFASVDPSYTFGDFRVVA